MLPILISVSVAPTSYFFCANAPLLVAASNARAAEKAPNRKLMAGMLFSLGTTMDVSLFLDMEHFPAPSCIEYLSAAPGNKKPPATVSRGAIFSLISRADCP
jgi:hypothetical protein